MEDRLEQIKLWQEGTHIRAALGPEEFALFRQDIYNQAAITLKVLAERLKLLDETEKSHK